MKNLQRTGVGKTERFIFQNVEVREVLSKKPGKQALKILEFPEKVKNPENLWDAMKCRTIGDMKEKTKWAKDNNRFERGYKADLDRVVFTHDVVFNSKGKRVAAAPGKAKNYSPERQKIMEGVEDYQLMEWIDAFLERVDHPRYDDWTLEQYVEKEVAKQVPKRKAKVETRKLAKVIKPKTGKGSPENIQQNAIAKEIKRKKEVCHKVVRGDTLGAIALGLSKKAKVNFSYNMPVKYESQELIKRGKRNPKKLLQANLIYPGQYVWLEGNTVVVSDDPRPAPAETPAPKKEEAETAPETMSQPTLETEIARLQATLDKIKLEKLKRKEDLPPYMTEKLIKEHAKLSQKIQEKTKIQYQIKKITGLEEIKVIEEAEINPYKETVPQINADIITFNKETDELALQAAALKKFETMRLPKSEDYLLPAWITQIGGNAANGAPEAVLLNISGINALKKGHSSLIEQLAELQQHQTEIATPRAEVDSIINSKNVDAAAQKKIDRFIEEYVKKGPQWLDQATGWKKLMDEVMAGFEQERTAWLEQTDVLPKKSEFQLAIQGNQKNPRTFPIRATETYGSRYELQGATNDANIPYVNEFRKLMTRFFGKKKTFLEHQKTPNTPYYFAAEHFFDLWETSPNFPPELKNTPVPQELVEALMTVGPLTQELKIEDDFNIMDEDYLLSIGGKKIGRFDNYQQLADLIRTSRDLPR